MNRHKNTAKVAHRSARARRAGAAIAAMGVPLFAAIAMSARAAEWSIIPAVDVAAGYDDNAGFAPGGDEDATSSSVGAQVRIDGRTELSRLRVDTGAYLTRYSEDIEDAERQYVTLRSSYQATERSRLALDGWFRRENFYRYVSQDTGTVDLGDVDTGLVETEVQRKTAIANPSWNYALSEISSVNIEYRARDVSFADAEGTDLVGYQQRDIWAGYSIKAGVRDDLNVLLGAGEYRRDDDDSETDVRRWRLGWTHGLTETAKARVFVGQNWATERTATEEREERGLAVEVGATERTELTTLDAVLSRDVQPSGLGTVESTQFRLRYRRKLSPLSELFIRGRVLRTEVLEGTGSDANRRYSEVVPELRWRLAPEWFISGSYRFRKRQREGLESAESNAIFIGITYASDRFREIP